MKKLLAVFIVLALLFSLSACTSKEIENNNSQPNSEVGFVAPENYTTVLTVTINPEFKLYLDGEGKVLAVEPVNDDAKSVVDAVSYENQNYIRNSLRAYADILLCFVRKAGFRVNHRGTARTDSRAIGQRNRHRYRKGSRD